MRTIGKILWTIFAWFTGVLTGALGITTLIAFLENEEDGYISKLLMRMYPKD